MTGLLTMSSSENSSILNLSSGSGTSQTDTRNLLTNRTQELSEPGPGRGQGSMSGNEQRPELVVGLADVLVQGSDVVPVPMEGLVGSGVLQHAGDGAQDVALLRL